MLVHEGARCREVPVVAEALLEERAGREHEMASQVEIDVGHAHDFGLFQELGRHPFGLRRSVYLESRGFGKRSCRNNCIQWDMSPVHGTGDVRSVNMECGMRVSSHANFTASHPIQDHACLP